MLQRRSSRFKHVVNLGYDGGFSDKLVRRFDVSHSNSAVVSVVDYGAVVPVDETPPLNPSSDQLHCPLSLVARRDRGGVGSWIRKLPQQLCNSHHGMPALSRLI